MAKIHQAELISSIRRQITKLKLANFSEISVKNQNSTIVFMWNESRSNLVSSCVFHYFKRQEFWRSSKQPQV